MAFSFVIFKEEMARRTSRPKTHTKQSFFVGRIWTSQTSNATISFVRLSSRVKMRRERFDWKITWRRNNKRSIYLWLKIYKKNHILTRTPKRSGQNGEHRRARNTRNKDNFLILVIYLRSQFYNNFKKNTKFVQIKTVVLFGTMPQSFNFTIIVVHRRTAPTLIRRMFKTHQK